MTKGDANMNETKAVKSTKEKTVSEQDASPQPAIDQRCELWDKFRTPETKFTKEFTRSGGFKGTAINATYMFRLATEAFGPCGMGWGYTSESSQVTGGPMYQSINDEMVLVGHEIVWIERVCFWYKIGDVSHYITNYGQTMFVTQFRNGGIFTDEEAPKKTITDAITKCLSMLGFASDVHMGLFDDNKYVNDVRAREKEVESKGPSRSTTKGKAVTKSKAGTKTNAKHAPEETEDTGPVKDEVGWKEWCDAIANDLEKVTTLGGRDELLKSIMPAFKECKREQPGISKTVQEMFVAKKKTLDSQIPELS